MQPHTSPEPVSPRILFIHLHPSSFVQDDLEILSRRYQVRTFHFTGGQAGNPLARAFGLLLSALRQLLWLRREVPKAVLVYGWFVDYHMALPIALARRHRLPAVVVVGGFDGNRLPELGYGVFQSRWRAALARRVLRGATYLLAVTPGLILGESRYATWPRSRRNGILAHVPSLSTPYEVLPTGFDPEQWPQGEDLRPPSVCTVAGISSERTLRIKGLDVFFEVARLLPEVPFLVVGIAPGFLRTVRARWRPSQNVRFLPPCPRETLVRTYRETSVYLQLSRTEGGLPMVLGEAMLSGCLPVASDAGGMPDTVGDAGFLVESPDPATVAPVVRHALGLGADPTAGPRARRRARERILTRFPREKRAERLLQVLGALESGEDPEAARREAEKRDAPPAP